MIILGINAYHGDSSACLVIDGQLIAAAEEERFRRIKHWAGFPAEAISYCLAAGKIQLSQVDHLAINQDAKANLLKKIGYTLAKRPNLSFILDRIRNKQEREAIDQQLARLFPQEQLKAKLHSVEHHLAHLYSAYAVAPFQAQAAVAVSVDGFGDFASAAWGLGHKGQVTVDDRIYFPHSLGIFYQALTQYLGFPHYGDEYKVMGLASYGQPKYLDKMRQLVILEEKGHFRLGLDYFRHHREKIDYEWENGQPVVGQLFSPALETLLGPARQPDEPLSSYHHDLAHSAQAMYEEALFHLLRELHQHYQHNNLALAGGCAMNSVANGKIRRQTPFEQVYVQAAAGDAGGAIGAAFAVWNQLTGEQSKTRMEHAYWGPVFDNEAIAQQIEAQQDALQAANCHWALIEDKDRLCQETAQAIADGQVVGWFQGRMEWGPRALGHRSILCDPRRANMKDILNQKIKRRESFRPFAPSILREAVADWFEEDDDVPFMMKVFPIRPDKRALIPAVTHVDGSGRLQTVSAKTNPLYHQLITAFAQLTDVPLVLNTSFNENEPVVCHPKEALDCFLRTKMDRLIIGDYQIWRSD